MMMCTRCKKRPAVVFISQLNVKDPDSKKNQGYRWYVSPVAGSSGEPKWQRTHGLAVRPMRNDP